jgi:hypothetical protein
MDDSRLILRFLVSSSLDDECSQVPTVKYGACH